MTTEVVPVDDPTRRSELCGAILCTLPEWVGIEEAIVDCRFYERCGFVALEEIHGLSDEANPCLIMVERP